MKTRKEEMRKATTPADAKSQNQIKFDEAQRRAASLSCNLTLNPELSESEKSNIMKRIAVEHSMVFIKNKLLERFNLEGEFDNKCIYDTFLYLSKGITNFEKLKREIISLDSVDFPEGWMDMYLFVLEFTHVKEVSQLMSHFESDTKLVLQGIVPSFLDWAISYNG